MTVFFWAIIAGLGNLVGAAVVIAGRARGIKVLDAFIGLGAGFMLAVTVGDIIPEALRLDPAGAPLFLLLGYLAVHLAQHVLAPHFHFGEETHAVSASVAVSALAGLLLHTFFDGVAIASGFAVSQALGVLLFTAVFLHKLPEGLTVASLFLAGGFRASRAVWAAAALGIATILGVGATRWIGPLAHHGLALAGGVTLYVAASNLVPEVQARRGWASPAAFFGGVAIFFLAQVALG